MAQLLEAIDNEQLQRDLHILENNELHYIK